MDLFYLCSLLICNAVISSIKMCPLVWITRLKGLTMSVVKNIFSDLFKWFFFEQVQSCLQSPNVSHIMRITAFYFIFFWYYEVSCIFGRDIHMTEKFAHPNTAFGCWQCTKLCKCSKCLNMSAFFLHKRSGGNKLDYGKSPPSGVQI